MSAASEFITPLQMFEQCRLYYPGWQFTLLDGKKPIRRAWQSEPPLDLDTLRAHQGNLGLRTGTISGVVVVDIDEGADISGLDLPPTMMVRTGSGGTHLYYAYDKPLKNSAGMLGPCAYCGSTVRLNPCPKHPQGKRCTSKIDIRADGGQVVFPGSIHPKTGQPYEFMEGYDPQNCGLAPLPQWIVDAYTIRKAPPRPVNGARPASGNGTHKKKPAYVRKAVENEAKAVVEAGEGTRNDQLNTSAFNLGQLVGAGVLDRSVAEQALEPAALAAGLGMLEIAATLASGLDAGIATPRVIPERPKLATPAPEAEGEPEADYFTGRPAPNKCKVEIIVTTDESEVNDEIIEVLAGDAKIYRRAGMLVKVVREAESAARIQRIPPADLRHKFSENIKFKTLKEATDKDLASGAEIIKIGEREFVKCNAHPPDWAVKAIHSKGDYPQIRPLQGTLSSPAIRPDGTLLAVEGYDPATGLYLTSTVPIRVPDHPTAEDVKISIALLDDLLADFPFEISAHFSGVISAIFSVLARPAIDGPVPLGAFDAPVPGSGKTLLADISGIICTGRVMVRTPFGASDEEMRKKMTAILLKGTPIVLFDNISRVVGGDTLAAVLTATEWSDRILGLSEMSPVLNISTVFWATGNNLEYDSDTARRVVPVRILPNVERPEEREGFRHPDLIRYTIENRPALLSAALTILRAWWSAGCPDQALRPWGSYGAWSFIVRNAIAWAGWPDPYIAKLEIAKIENTDRETIIGVLCAIEHLDPYNRGLTANEILDAAITERLPHAERTFVIEFATPRGGRPNLRTLGNKLKSARDRIIGGKALKFLRRGNLGALWTVCTVGDSGDSGDSVPYSPRAYAHDARAHTCTKQPGAESPESPESPDYPPSWDTV